MAPRFIPSALASCLLLGLVLLTGCDAVLGLKDPSLLADGGPVEAAREGGHGGQGGQGGKRAQSGHGGSSSEDAGVSNANPTRPETSAPMQVCVGPGRDCSNGGCCIKGNSCAKHEGGTSCWPDCSSNEDCASGCCVPFADGKSSVCAPASACAPLSAPTDPPDAGATSKADAAAAPATDKCAPSGTSCGPATPCCEGEELCVDRGNDSRVCSHPCSSDSECGAECCRDFPEGRACAVPTLCGLDPCTGPAADYGYACGKALGADPSRLYLCLRGRTFGSVACAAGCFENVPGEWDFCNGDDPCANYPVDADVCGEKLGPKADKAVLYRCQGQRTISQMSCPGCVASDPGQRDTCS